MLCALGLAALLLGGAATAAPVVSTLSNGLKVCIAADFASDLVAVQIVTRATADCEPDDKVGLRTVLQHALRGALDDRAKADPNLAFLLDMQDSGAALEVNCDWEYVSLGYAGTSETLSDALPVLADAVFRPQITEEQFTAARALVQGAAGGPAAAPAESTISLFRLALLGRPSRAYPLGTPETLEAISLADLNAFHRRFCVPALSAVAIVGPVDARQTQALVNRCFGDLPAGDPSLPPPPDARTSPEARVATNAELAPGDEQRMDIASLVVGVPAPGLGDADEAVTYVLHALLAGEGGRDGRLTQDDHLWQALGLPFSDPASRRGKFVESLPPPTSLRSHLAIHAYAAPRQAEAAREALLDEFEGFAAKPPTGEELLRAREYVAGALSVLYEAPRNRALLMGRAALLGRREATGGDLAGRILAVTPQDVQRVAKAFFGTHAVALELPGP